MTSNFSVARVVLVVVAAACVALVIAALLVVSLRPAPQAHAENTPEGVVQRYLMAFESEDLPAMRGFVLQGESRMPCNPEPYATQPLEVRLLSSTVGTADATVLTRFDTADARFLPWPDLSSYEDAFELRKVNGTWLIDRMPWQVGLCTAEEMGY
ncbi:hypothetical protein OF385_04420 [Glutamicibacter sp. JL.03c]|uniref:hypothetical protein n=1 Tax=Glutamicibacter sp. JL.03c TaxID=2984842 RepID=UPI0021F79218|nr:hypothetical protein [Glutamicibacter sp. JL.03c]UYQ78404.1 hypothetical protein OF385_04420 [Glutamicibacter sp. JL.03c]